MAENLSFNTFALLNEATTNDAHRPECLVLEYHEETITIASSEGTVEAPTELGTVYGLIDLSYVSGGAADATDSIKLVTDGVISTSAVTVNAKSEDISNGDVAVRFLLVGKKSESVLINDPS